MQSEQGCRFIHPPPLDRLAVEKEFLSLDATVYRVLPVRLRSGKIFTEGGQGNGCRQPVFLRPIVGYN